MSLLLCAATSFEIAPTLQYLKEQQLDKQIAVLFTGMGLMATTYSLMKQITVQNPSLVIQAGIAGAIDTKIQLGQVVAIQSESLGDLGVNEATGFKDVFTLGFNQRNSFPFTNGQLVNTTTLLQETGLSLVNAVSVNEISTNTDRINYYQQTLGAQVESMEGAALHYVCLQENVPFVQVRSISNFIGERNKQAWKLQEAIEHLNLELQLLISKHI